MLSKEKRYDFKKELLKVHKEDRRDFSATPTEYEFVIPDGMAVVLPQSYDAVVMTAARDFTDYMLVSMKQAAMVTTIRPNTPCLTMRYNQDLGTAAGYMGYRITVSDTGITLEGYDSPGLAQGLYFLEDLMNLRKAPFLEKKATARKALFSPRFAQSPFGMNEYSDATLSHMAHLGYDAILLWIKGPNLTLRGDYIDMPLLCERAEKYGIQVYIQIHGEHSKHPDDPGAQEYYDELYGKIFEFCPKIKGIELVGEANEFHSHDPNVGKSPLSANYEDNIPITKVTPGYWPCSDYPQWVDMIKKSIRKHRPDADIVFCTYNWSWVPEEDRVKLIEALPEDISLLAAWDMCHPYKVGEATGNIVDYSLRQTEASNYFASEGRAAKKRGLRLYSTTNTAGLTWDFGVIPYEPMPYQWLKRMEAVVKAHEEWGLCGTLECIHYGFYPSFISDLEKWAFFTHDEDLMDVLHAILKRDFGTENFEVVDRAMRLWSEAITHYVPCNEDQYGAFRTGPAYPFWVNDPRVGFRQMPDQGLIPKEFKNLFKWSIYFPGYTPNYDFNRGNSMPGVRIFGEIEEIEVMSRLFLEGIEALESIANPNERLRRVLNIGKFMYRSCITTIHFKRLYILVQQLNIAGTSSKALELLDQIEVLLREERENVEQTIPIVQMDSRLGWEPSMDYVGDEKCLRWKLRQLDHELNYTLNEHRKACLL